MGKKSKTLVVAPPNAPSEDLDRTQNALRWAIEGKGYEEIGARLDISAWEAREVVSTAFARQQSESLAELQAQSELRILDVIRRLNHDLALAANQPEKNAIYALILRAESDRRKLLGLDIPSGTPDDLQAANRG